MPFVWPSLPPWLIHLALFPFLSLSLCPRNSSSEQENGFVFVPPSLCACVSSRLSVYERMYVYVYIRYVYTIYICFCTCNAMLVRPKWKHLCALPMCVYCIVNVCMLVCLHVYMCACIRNITQLSEYQLNSMWRTLRRTTLLRSPAALTLPTPLPAAAVAVVVVLSLPIQLLPRVLQRLTLTAGREGRWRQGEHHKNKTKSGKIIIPIYRPVWIRKGGGSESWGGRLPFPRVLQNREGYKELVPGQSRYWRTTQAANNRCTKSRHRYEEDKVTYKFNLKFVKN